MKSHKVKQSSQKHITLLNDLLKALHCFLKEKAGISLYTSWLLNISIGIHVWRHRGPHVTFASCLSAITHFLNTVSSSSTVTVCKISYQPCVFLLNLNVCIGWQSKSAMRSVCWPLMRVHLNSNPYKITGHWVMKTVPTLLWESASWILDLMHLENILKHLLG